MEHLRRKTSTLSHAAVRQSKCRFRYPLSEFALIRVPSRLKLMVKTEVRDPECFRGHQRTRRACAPESGCGCCAFSNRAILGELVILNQTEAPLDQGLFVFVGGGDSIEEGDDAFF